LKAHKAFYDEVRKKWDGRPFEAKSFDSLPPNATEKVLRSPTCDEMNKRREHYQRKY
jgi:hypothetical protein